MAEHIDFRSTQAQADFPTILHNRGIELQGEGAQRRARCPFHDDSEPSLSVNVNTNIFNCFGVSCRASGNILEFVMRTDSVAIPKAARAIARECGFELPLKQSEAPKTAAQAPRAATHEESCAPSPSEPTAAPVEPDKAEPESNAPNKPLGFALKLATDHSYLEERGLDDERITRFGLGMAERGMMKGRLCIPIHNSAGELVAYGGRYAAAAVPEGEDRYRFPEGFRKTMELYNLHRAVARMEAAETSAITLVEGFFDAIALDMLAVPAVALMGNAELSEAQVSLLRSASVTHVTVMMDGNEPGRIASAQIIGQLAHQFWVRAASVPAGREPDTLTAEELAALVAVVG